MRDCPQCQAECDDAHKFCPACGFPIGKLVEVADDSLIGRTLPGGVVILDLVGVGGMGRVYRAEQTNLGRTVAVKIIHPYLIGEENAAARFFTEARAASRLNHPNSVAVHDFGKTQDGQLYLVMEFLRGRDLARVQYEDGALTLPRIINVLRQVLAALSEAHHLDIIHRDLKPENVILEPVRQGGDFVKVVDFGLAKMKVMEKGITHPGIVCGTPEYMSPEQGRGDPLDARSDVYAVGVILYQLLTGRLPFEAESPTQVVLMHLSEAPQDPRRVAPSRDIPEAIVQIVMRALAKEPADRFADADAFSDALLECLNTLDGSARPPAALVKCAACGAMNPPMQKFCGECGKAAMMVRASMPGAASADLTDVDGPATQRPADDGASLLPLVGRDEELAWLDERRKDARVSLVGAHIIGDAGAGKTRLMQAFAGLASSDGDTVIIVGPDPSWAEIGYYGVRAAIQKLAALPNGGGASHDWEGASPDVRRGLAEVFEQAGQLRAGVASEERRFAIAEALRWAIARASDRVRGRRVVLLVDDFNHVDGASRNAFSDLLSSPPPVPVLLVVAYSPGFELRWPGSAATGCVLRGLAPTGVSALLARSSATMAPPSAEARGMAPLYIEQLLRLSNEQGGPAPSRLADLIALRVERLPPHARRVLQAVAVYGDDAAEEVIAKLLSDPTDVPSALVWLRRAGMVEQFTTDAQATKAVRTTHPLLREVVLATVPAAVKKALHARASEVCEALGASLEVRALHQYHAQNTFQALILLDTLSGRCSGRGDQQGAVTALRRGLELARLELFRGELDDPLRAVLIFSWKLGEALATAGDFTDAEGILREALDIAETGDDRARILGALAGVAHGRDRRNEAFAYLRDALELAQRSGVHELLDPLESLKRRISL